MKKLEGKQILLGISGGIAAYKSADLVRRLQDQGAEVRVVMTTGAQAFIQPLTFQALSGNPVHTSLLDEQAEAAMGHIELARWPDLILIAPASANSLARLAHGMADDLLSTLCLATDKPILVAPAMNRLMWANEATQANVATLAARGMTVIAPDAGEQACGEVGAGRMPEPLALVQSVIDFFIPSEQPLKGLKVVMTAGPTREAIDPVRYISNHSSGKMGYALAQAAQRAGADVTLVSGPVTLSPPASVDVIPVMSAREMHEAVLQQTASADIFIGVAAVADYHVREVADHKIKKNNDTMVIELAKNPDILADVSVSTPRPFCVGFAAETQDLEHYARGKLQRKKLDMICANFVGSSDIGFNSDNNAMQVFWGEQGVAHLDLSSKDNIAEQLVVLIAARYNEKRVK